MLLVGVLVGLEIPLVMRILKRQPRDRYAAEGPGLAGAHLRLPGCAGGVDRVSLALVPQLGLVRTGAFFGLLNAVVAAWALWLFRAELRGSGSMRRRARTTARVLGVFASPTT